MIDLEKFVKVDGKDWNERQLEADKKIEKAWNNLQLAFRIIMIISTCMFLTGAFMKMGV
jgi:hypothetical protein